MKALSLRSVAARLDLSTKTVERMMKRGEFPGPAMWLNPQSPRWWEATVDLWLLAKQGPKPEAVKSKKPRTTGDNRGQIEPPK